MLTDEQAIKLHQCAALDEPLTAEEQAELEAWYAKQDEEEAKTLKLDEKDGELEEIRQKLRVSLNQLVVETQRLQQIEEENEALHREVTSLRQRLQQSQMPRAA